jgi:Holliday junction DNA helicase RuvB
MRNKEPIKNGDNPVPEVETPATYRPAAFEEVVGQTDIVRRLKILVERAKISRTVLSHVLFVGPEGSGKETMAHLVARQLGVNLRSTTGLYIERGGDLAAIVNDLDQGDVLFIDGIDHLRKELIAVLAPAMTIFELNIIVGKGPGARAMRLAVKPFTLIGSVLKESDCPRLLVNSFHGVFSFRPYDTSEIQEIIERIARYTALSIEPSAAALVAGLANGSPARAESLLQRLTALRIVRSMRTMPKSYSHCSG